MPEPDGPEDERLLYVVTAAGVEGGAGGGDGGGLPAGEPAGDEAAPESGLHFDSSCYGATNRPS